MAVTVRVRLLNLVRDGSRAAMARLAEVDLGPGEDTTAVHRGHHRHLSQDDDTIRRRGMAGPIHELDLAPNRGRLDDVMEAGPSLQNGDNLGNLYSLNLRFCPLVRTSPQR
jgi:hypothetical protein